MKIAVIGYITRDNKITVSYDTVSEEYIVDEEFIDRDIPINVGISYSVKSKKEVKESLKRFKKDFYRAK